ncbi:MAG: hypothetical protein ACYC6Y_05615 [Thermoguttaceae bacterium]
MKLCLGLLLVACVCESLCAQVAEPSNYRGWRTLRLFNGLVELQVVPEIGGRVIQNRRRRIRPKLWMPGNRRHCSRRGKKNTMIFRHAAPILFLLLPCGLPAAETVIRPAIIPVEEGSIQNAGSGTEIWRGGPDNGESRLVKYAVRVSDYSVNSMIRISWCDYETKEGQYLFAKLDEHFEHCIRYGQKLNIGCFVTSGNHGLTIDDGLCAYPAYVHEALQNSQQKDVKYTPSRGRITRWEPNFENDYFFERYDALLAAFAEYLEGSLTIDTPGYRPCRLRGLAQYRSDTDLRPVATPLRHQGRRRQGDLDRQFDPRLANRLSR